MKISVIGAAGMVGSQVAAEAAERGHDVHAYTRSGNAPQGLTAQPLSLHDAEAVTSVVNGSDATVISVAGRDDYEAIVTAHEQIIAAHPTGRILVVGGAGGLQVGEGLLLDSPEFPAEYLPEAKAFTQVYTDYAASTGLDWTLIAPSSEIAPGARTGSYTTNHDHPAGNFVSTQDFAVALVDEIENPAHQQRRFTVASTDETAARG